ncbi:MAG TPA: DUF3303 family protein [Chloroflexota bacterium]
MLYYCDFTWHHGTTMQQVRQRILDQDQANGQIVRRCLKGWYSLAGGGAGFLLMETEDPAELTNLLTPYMDLMAWDVRAIYQLDYEQALQRFRSS